MEGSEPEPADDAGGFRVYADYIREHLENQEVRKKSLEDRGSFVITTSGALATILLGLTSLAFGAMSAEVVAIAFIAVAVAIIL